MLGLLSFLVLAGAAAAKPHLSLHFSTLCKECQMHMNAIEFMVWRAGNETTAQEAGVLSRFNVTLDFYFLNGRIQPDGTYLDGSCEKGAVGTEHGPYLCATDRIAKCAQHATGYDATKWFDFTHCMFMAMDVLKCNKNEHCKMQTTFQKRLDLVLPTCFARAPWVNEQEVMHCAYGPLGKHLLAHSYARTQQTRQDGFAAVYLDGEHLTDLDKFWRKTPDALLYGRALLTHLCDKLEGEAPFMSACEGPLLRLE